MRPSSCKELPAASNEWPRRVSRAIQSLVHAPAETAAGADERSQPRVVRENRIMSAVSRDSDDELLVRASAGDGDAFASFYRRYLATVVGFCLRRTGDRELAADLSAEVFAAALIACSRYRPGEGPALAWLYGIAAHKLADSRRQGRVQDAARRELGLQRLVLDDEDLERVDQLAAVDGGRALLNAAVASLPSDQRDAVLGRIVAEQSYRELANEFQCSELVVRQRVSRGLRALRIRTKEAL